MKEKYYIIGSVLFSTGLMCFVDGVIVPPYLLKSIIKVILFLMIPLFYAVIYKEKMNGFKRMFIPKKKNFLVALLLGGGVFAVILGAYLVFRNVIDFSGIKDSLVSGIGVNAGNFVYVATYIALVNSLLEEFFFRGFAFLLLKKQTNRKFAYLFSGVMFAVYHAGMTSGWFHPIIYVLVMLGLFAGASIFNFLNEKCENIYPSWLVHMCANLAINTVGFILFGLI